MQTRQAITLNYITADRYQICSSIHFNPSNLIELWTKWTVLQPGDLSNNNFAFSFFLVKIFQGEAECEKYDTFALCIQIISYFKE